MAVACEYVNIEEMTKSGLCTAFSAHYCANRSHHLRLPLKFELNFSFLFKIRASGAGSLNDEARCGSISHFLLPVVTRQPFCFRAGCSRPAPPPSPSSRRSPLHQVQKKPRSRPEVAKLCKVGCETRPRFIVLPLVRERSCSNCPHSLSRTRTGKPIEHSQRRPLNATAALLHRIGLRRRPSSSGIGRTLLSSLLA